MDDDPQRGLTQNICAGNVDKLVDEFLDDLKTRDAPFDTLRGYRRELHGFLDWLTRSGNAISHPDSISDSDIRGYLQMLHERGLNNSTRAKALAVVRTWLDFLGRGGYVKENVGKLVKRPRVHEPAISIPPAREVLHMLDQLSNISLAWPSRDTAIIAMLYICLLLPSELISLNVQDFDWGKNEIIVSGRRDRRVPMLSGVRTAIETYLAERKALVSAAQARGYDTSAFIIGQTLNGILGRHGRARLLVRQINLIVEGAMEHFPHLSYATPTTLRKAGAVHMLDNGADIRSVAKLMGVELRAVERLSRLSTTKKREEVDRTHPRGR